MRLLPQELCSGLQILINKKPKVGYNKFMIDKNGLIIGIGDILIPDAGQKVEVLGFTLSEGIECIEGRQVEHLEFGCLINQENLSARWTKEVTPLE